jgi:stage II sporulation protein D
MGDVYINGSSGVLSGGLSSAYAVGADGEAALIPGGTVYAVTGSGETEAIGQDERVSGSADGKVNGVFTLSGIGRGHNVGMSQWGAYAMAFYHDKTFEEIIRFYYTGDTIG